MIATPIALADPHTRLSDITAHEPSCVYQAFITAIAARDLPKVLASMSSHYGYDLSRHNGKRDFRQFFELWCETYPRKVDVVAWFIDGDTTTLEIEDELNGTLVTSHAGLSFESGAWRVAWERFAVGRKRIDLTTPTSLGAGHLIQPSAAPTGMNRRSTDYISGKENLFAAFPSSAIG